MSDPEIESLEIRCPRLGSIIPFRYCLISGERDMPCFKILDCWWEIFDVEAYLRKNLPEGVFRNLIGAQPRPKVASIVEIAEKVRKDK
ncbi:MAG: hypothetical protein ACOC7W_00355 [Desulfosalsimonas sp.]